MRAAAICSSVSPIMAIVWLEISTSPRVRPPRAHEVAHAGVRLRPGLAEALLDVGTDLRAEPEDETAARHELQVVRGIGARHRIPREGDRDAGRQPDPRRMLRGEREREEG